MIFLVSRHARLPFESTAVLDCMHCSIISAYLIRIGSQYIVSPAVFSSVLNVVISTYVEIFETFDNGDHL